MFWQVEAYRPNDLACHGRFGITARTAPVVSFALLQAVTLLAYLILASLIAWELRFLSVYLVVIIVELFIQKK